MSSSVSYYHWSNAGDLLTCMAGIKQIFDEKGKKGIVIQRLNTEASYYEGAVHPIEDKWGNQVCMNEKMWEMLVPLIESQEYIDHCEIFEGQKTEINLDMGREQPVVPKNTNLYYYSSLVIPQMVSDLSEKWLTIPEPHNKFMEIIIPDHVLVTRTQRYTNPLITYFFLKEYEDKLIFAGTEKEHKKFCDDFKLSIPLLVINNFLELAQAVQSCRFTLSNQTFIYHISEGLKKTRLLEICPQVPNVWPAGKNGYPFMHQVNLEYFFNKLINETIR
jgi:hypothetical protein